MHTARGLYSFTLLEGYNLREGGIITVSLNTVALEVLSHDLNLLIWWAVSSRVDSARKAFNLVLPLCFLASEVFEFKVGDGAAERAPHPHHPLRLHGHRFFFFFLLRLSGFTVLLLDLPLLFVILTQREIRARKEFIVMGALSLVDSVNGLGHLLAGLARICCIEKGSFF